MSDLKPKNPSYAGRQYADDSMTPDEISVSRNEYNDEIPTDQPKHGNATPEHSNPAYIGGHYADHPKGYGGTPVSGGGASKEVADVDVHKADRGKEA